MLFDLQIFSGGVYPPSATSRTITFSISNSFGINLIHLFDEKKDGAAGNSIVCFVLRSPVMPFDRSKTKNANCFEERNGFGNGKCELSALQEGEKLRCKFLARKSAKLFAKVQFFGKERCKIHRQFQRYLGDVTSVSLSLSLSLSLYLSLSLSPSAPHAQYRKRFRASYNL